MARPFTGLNFCCTGLGSAHRQELDSQITALGGTLHVDLMSSVNFLVVGGRRTEKYKYSVRYRHDISFVSAAAISEVHASYLAGDDPPNIRQCLLPVFADMIVCVARVDAPSSEDRRRLFAERFRQPPAQAVPKTMPEDPFSAPELLSVLLTEGAAASGTLTSDCSVLVGTHPHGKRYDMARQWHVPVVHPMWVHDSCLRGAALDLDDYVLTPGAFNLYSSASFTWKGLYAARIRPPAASAGPGLGLIPGAAIEKRDRAGLKKSSEVWTSIMSSTVARPTKQVRDSAWGQDDDADTAAGSGRDSDSDSDNGAGAASSRNPHRSLANMDASARARTLAARIDSLAPPTPADSHASGSRVSALFAGLCFLPVGLSVPQQNLLRSVVQSHKGSIATDAADSAITHILLLVRDGPQAHLMLSMLPSATKGRINRKEVAIVTDWFVERSVYYGQVRQDAWCRPRDGVVPSLQRFRVCITGFTGVELLHIEKLVGFLNLEYCDVFNAKRDLLIVNVNLFKRALLQNSPKLFSYAHKDILDCPVYKNGDDSRSVSAMSSRNKINAAKKWNIPVVSIAYLWEMVEVSGHQPNLQFPDISDLQWCIYAPKTVPRPGSLFEYVTNAKKDSASESAGADDDKEERVQLPSPRKSKEKQTYGRLVGGGESLTEKLLQSKEKQSLEPEENAGEANISIDGDQNLTQVGYGSADENRDGDELWKKIEDLNERIPKRRRTRHVHE